MKPTSFTALRGTIAALVVLAGCQKAPPAADAVASSTEGREAPGSTDPSAALAPTADNRICSLLTAAEVSAIMGKPLIQPPGSCDYGLDPAAKEKVLQQAGPSGGKPGNGGPSDLAALMKSMSQGGGGIQRMTDTMMQQLTLTVSARQDDMTEERVKAIYARIGESVGQAVPPGMLGTSGVIQGLDEVPGVGDWAFATNVATVGIAGMSIRGRLLEARRGPWHATISATVAPDPGTATLDKQLAGVARALLAKL